jgi:Uncharacterized lipoprotein
MRAISVVAARLMIVLAAVIAACGCTQNAEVALAPPAAAVSVASTGGGRPITIARPLDARPTPDAIGGLVDSNGTVSAAARPTNDPAVWIGDSFASGLTAAGYRIYRSETRTQAATPVVLVITVNEVYAKFRRAGWSTYTGEARVAVKVEAFHDGQHLFTRTYSGTASNDYPASVSGPTAEDYQQALQEAMRAMLDRAIPNLAAALEKETAS